MGRVHELKVALVMITMLLKLLIMPELPTRLRKQLAKHFVIWRRER
ncbi:hypothetical protein ES708_17560 [subsurface metagenome]